MLATSEKPEKPEKTATPPRRHAPAIPLETPPERPHRRKFSAHTEQATLVKTIGKRLKEARELCNLSQHAASKRLGYNNPSRISRLEKAADISSVPLWLIARASEVYEVSIDFLFGYTDDFEYGERMTQEREVSAWLKRTWEDQRMRDIKTIKLLHDRHRLCADATQQLLLLVKETNDALDRMRQLNPEFDDMRAGSRVILFAGQANEVANYALRLLHKFKRECELASLDNPQLRLF